MPPGHQKSKIVCPCLQVAEGELVRAIRGCRIQSLEDIIEYTSAGDGCTACHPLLQDYLERERSKGLTCPSPAAPTDS